MMERHSIPAPVRTRCAPAPRVGLGLALLLAALTLGPAPASSGAPPAAAASEPTDAEKAAARQLFNDGLALEKKASWEEALATFEKVSKVIMTPQVRYHMALCHANLGHMVEAINGFELATQEAKLAGDKARDVTENAPSRLAELRERVGYVRIKITGQVRTSRILIDGRPLALALIDTDLPLNPGAHLLEVETGGVIADKRDLQIERQTTAEVELRIDDPEPAPAPSAGTGAEVPTEPAPPGADEGDPQIPAYAVGAAGLLLLAGGAVFWGLRESTVADVRDSCNGDDAGCDPALQDKADLGQSYTTVGRVLLPVGGTALAAGVVLWFLLAPSEGDGPTTTEVAARVLPTPNGVVVVGRF
jgi:hypothetical protein